MKNNKKSKNSNKKQNMVNLLLIVYMYNCLNMKRRDFIKCGLAGIAILSTKWLAGCLEDEDYTGVEITLNISEAYLEMIDSTPVYMWLFSTNETGPRFPGPLIEAEEGHVLRITINNELDEDHSFAIPGVVDSGIIAPGETKIIQFSAPQAGTYMYMDPLNAPVNRILGLAGPMVIYPRNGSKTPYSNPTPNVTKLFDDLGNSAHFPGETWISDESANRTRIWFFTQVDPAFNIIAENGTEISAEDIQNNFLPRYFTINGRSGAFATHDANTVPSGRIGQPHLIRILNSGLATHSPHIHGNHVYVLSVDGEVKENVWSVDTFTVPPLSRVDWLLPFQRPPDIPGNTATPLNELIPEELALVLGDVPQSPLEWPMHCHTEQSQTAAGGNYPQGLVTHWEIIV